MTHSCVQLGGSDACAASELAAARRASYIITSVNRLHLNSWAYTNSDACSLLANPGRGISCSSRDVLLCRFKLCYVLLKVWPFQLFSMFSILKPAVFLISRFKTNNDNNRTLQSLRDDKAE